MYVCIAVVVRNVCFILLYVWYVCDIYFAVRALCAPGERILQAIAKTCDELGVNWQKEYFGAW